MRTTDRRVAAWSLALIALIASSACTAAAAEAPDRREYVDQLETICKPDATATQRAMNGARGDVQAERLQVAAHKFSKAAKIFGWTVVKISKVPRPTADRSRLKKWFGYLEQQQERYLVEITEKLKAEQPIQAQRLTARFIHNGNLANNVVLAFGFEYCSFKFSRYG